MPGAHGTGQVRGRRGAESGRHRAHQEGHGAGRRRPVPGETREQSATTPDAHDALPGMPIFYSESEKNR